MGWRTKRWEGGYIALSYFPRDRMPRPTQRPLRRARPAVTEEYE